MTDQEIRQQIIRKRRRQRTKRRLISTVLALAIALGSGYALGTHLGNKKHAEEMAGIISVAADTPMVKVALPEIGSKGGKKFWKWYGFSSRVEWCAIFVSWCEDQCGFIKADKAPSFAMVSDGANWFKRHDQWLEADAVPEPGDIIFFDWEQDDSLDHVGIVAGVVDGKIITIEGNSSNRCRMKRYEEGSPVIGGFGHIIVK